MFLDESHVIGQFGAMYNGDRSRKTTLVEYGFRLPSALDNRPLKFEEFERKMRQGDLRLRHAGRLREEATPARWSSSWCGPPAWWTPSSRCARHPPGGRRAAGDPPACRAARARADHHADQAHGRAAHRLTSATTASRCATCTPTSTPWSAWRSCATCAWAFRRAGGINLLREGLDIPEVSLVAILDADKEGFCAPSDPHADVVTDSMKSAIGETRAPPRQANRLQRRAWHHAAQRRQKCATRSTVYSEGAGKPGSADEEEAAGRRSEELSEKGPSQANQAPGKADAGTRPQPRIRAGSPFVRPTGPAARRAGFGAQAGPVTADPVIGAQGATKGLAPNRQNSIWRESGSHKPTKIIGNDLVGIERVLPAPLTNPVRPQNEGVARVHHQRPFRGHRHDRPGLARAQWAGGWRHQPAPADLPVLPEQLFVAPQRTGRVHPWPRRRLHLAARPGTSRWPTSSPPWTKP